jgi:CBS-domain-containing membrane protein
MLMTQLDLNAVLARIDIDQIVAKVDINAIVERVDIDALVQRTELEAIVARASAGVATDLVDSVRSAGVGLDSFVHRQVDRLLRRNGSTRPSGPPLLVPQLGHESS